MIKTRAVRSLSSLFVLLTLAVSCGSTSTSENEVVSGAESNVAEGSTISWQSLGCEEPAPLVVESSEALETDVGLAADSLAATYGVSLEEAKRRLRLQQDLGQRRAEVQAAEVGRIARIETQHEPYFAAVVTLTGTEPISDKTREILCRTPDLEVRLGAQFTQDELVGETMRLSRLLDDFGDLTGFGPGNQQLEFTVINDAERDRLDEFLSTATTFPYVVDSLGIPPLDLDPGVPFPLLDVTGRDSFGVGLGGLLTIDGPCVYLNDQLVVLPARETTWNPDTGVLNTGGGDLRSGDQVTGGGYEYNGVLTELDQPPDPTCRLDSGVVQGSFSPLDPNATPAPMPPPTPE